MPDARCPMPDAPDAEGVTVNAQVTRSDLLFVCTANICRSPFAAELSGHLTDLACSSAGIRGFDGAPMDPPMLAELAARGADGGRFRSRTLTSPMIDQADLVLTMEVAQRTRILADAPGLVAKVFTVAQFARAVSDAGDGLRGGPLLSAVRRSRGLARPVDDVADPYGRGPAAAAAAADHIETLVGSFLSRL